MLRQAIVPYLIQMMEILLFGSLTIAMFTEGWEQQVSVVALLESGFSERRGKGLGGPGLGDLLAEAGQSLGVLLDEEHVDRLVQGEDCLMFEEGLDRDHR